MAKKLQDIPVTFNVNPLVPSYNRNAGGFGSWLVNEFQPNSFGQLSLETAQKSQKMFNDAFEKYKDREFPGDLKFVYKSGTNGIRADGNTIYFDEKGDPTQSLQNMYQILDSRALKVREEKVELPPVGKGTETTSSQSEKQKEQCKKKTWEENGKTFEEYYTLDEPPKLVLSEVKNGDKLEQKTEYQPDGSEIRTSYDDQGSHSVVVKEDKVQDAYDVDKDGKKITLQEMTGTVQKNVEAFYQQQRQAVANTENGAVKQAAWDEVFYSLYPDKKDEVKVKQIEELKKSHPELYAAERKKAAVQMRDHLLEQQKNTPFASEKEAISQKLEALYQQFPELTPAQTQSMPAGLEDIITSLPGQILLMVAFLASGLLGKMPLTDTSNGKNPPSEEAGGKPDAAAALEKRQNTAASPGTVDTLKKPEQLTH